MVTAQPLIGHLEAPTVFGTCNMVGESASIVNTISEKQDQQLGECCQRPSTGVFYSAKHGQERRHQLAVAQLLVA
jgi:hypothetical protein